jgi:hypothetical protein
MNWDQIEVKWAAMTRRVRADLPVDKTDTTGTSLRQGTTIKKTTTIVLERQFAAKADHHERMPFE